ncbi:hypothetical protein phytr_6030 [Candidatus Phycorickettsia trachydisci]|uniref:Nucleoside-diphosphate sugar epimerase n=1 Tax=Candidatus Phycorickettsia trachydisci TaxID=2115978 RepID=A0A2P1P8F7_9RICK|nr:ELM1/GtrOC1 family putative glycosyltransferase [Candidatus Phycorickettsia trachydisci]AVP87544.1 hypothetical protein phytr_6030 [Candidatus Phycorickettsia trachydisci]
MCGVGHNITFSVRKRAWILKDHRVGSTNQMLALAKALDLDYELKNIEYRLLISWLPNFLLPGIWHVDKNKSDNLDLSTNRPEVIISASRRCALVAVYLKKPNPSLKIINIMRPEVAHSFFDYVILPQHDLAGKSDNTIEIIGALNDSYDQMQKAPKMDEIHQDVGDFIGIVIGGATRNFDFTYKDAAYLVKYIQKAAQNISCNFVITFSRRTDQRVKQIVKEAFESSVIYDPSEGYQDNIYFSILKSAKYIIATGDSISMCSEIASSGKPCYIYKPLGIIKSPKHERFINQLVNNKIASLLGEDTKLEDYNYEPLNEVERIAKLIKL